MTEVYLYVYIYNTEIRWPTIHEFEDLIDQHESLGAFVGYIDGSKHRIQRPGA
jgi:hypothetical protein